MGYRIHIAGWRTGWQELGLVLAAAMPICGLLAFDRRGKPTKDVEETPTATEASATLGQALATPCFWVFSLSISFFGLVTAGISLCQQLILEERGLPAEVFTNVLVIGLLTGMVANLVAGGLSRVCRLSHLLAAAMLLLGVSYTILPLAQTPGQAYGFAVVQGIAGGILTVVFFAVWRQAFGAEHLGRIQGAAQMLTVFASALGPMLVADSNAAAGTYTKILLAFAAVSVAFAVVAWFTPVPAASTGASRVPSAAELSASLQESPA